ncbi:hypothetical protein [Agromyces ramosus]|uniref:Lipoprotein n=1 Tax=Agromyces ramosus TaxID=33879 RepID=A0ABU0R5Q4_9MICO|nr:hypothetical protein [Agromyces ramosus]MDQ0893417.1 hypothetical protein [Agromyces ramosus]
MPTALPTGPRARRAAAALAAAGVLALVLVGCGGTPAPTPSPEPSASAAEPIFASDEEALAAAKAAYERYLATVDQLTQDGGQDPDRIRDAVADGYVEELLDSLKSLRESGNRTSGTTAYDSMEVLERHEDDGVARVTVYVCLDVTGVRVLDANGADATPEGRDERRALQAFFESAAVGSEELLPSGSESWSGDDFC